MTLPINDIPYSKPKYGQAFRSAEVQKSASEFSHGLDLKSYHMKESYKIK